MLISKQHACTFDTPSPSTLPTASALYLVEIRLFLDLISETFFSKVQMNPSFPCLSYFHLLISSPSSSLLYPRSLLINTATLRFGRVNQFCASSRGSTPPSQFEWTSGLTGHLDRIGWRFGSQTSRPDPVFWILIILMSQRHELVK